MLCLDDKNRVSNIVTMLHINAISSKLVTLSPLKLYPSADNEVLKYTVQVDRILNVFQFKKWVDRISQ